VRSFQRGLDAKRAAGGDPVGYVDSSLEGRVPGPWPCPNQ